MNQVLFAVLLLLLIGSASAQTIGTDICACQPSTITFDLVFSLECDDTNVGGPGINETACLVETRGSTPSDPFPVTVTEVQVLELDQNLQIVGQSVYTDTFVDGDNITYTSIVKREPNTITGTSLPRGFQVSITGLSKTEESLVNSWVIIYTNDCGIFPLLEVGEKIGWVKFVSIKIASMNRC